MSTPVVVVGADDYIAPFGAIRKVPGLKAYERACDRCGIRYRVASPSLYRRRGQEIPVLCPDCRPWLCPQGHDKAVVGVNNHGSCMECRRERARERYAEEADQ